LSRILKDVVARLNALMRLDHDAIAAYKVAVGELRSPRDPDRLRAALADHRRHVDDLALLVRNLGGEPASYRDLRQLLAGGTPPLRPSVQPSGVMEERALLEAIRKNEQGCLEAYEAAASQPGIPVDVRESMERNRNDERLHLLWITRWFDQARTPM
jgi:hypothetical protein